MNTLSILAKKRDAGELSADEIRFMVGGLVDGSIADYQLAAWAMAIACRGLSVAEIEFLTDAMLDSGDRLSRASDRPRVDKHSTGGLGDKVSLVLAPLLAIFDVDVPMLSGRGLGTTGGTLDKLESYPGFRCDLSEQEIASQLQEIGCVITSTTERIAPADRRLYALRDVTGTVPSIGLITSSIMSKKLAESLDALVLDVKVGSAAFMHTLADARRLADSLTKTGKRFKVATSAVISDMNQPLGWMVGNACEANEAVHTLQGRGPSDLRELVLRLGSMALTATKTFRTLERASQQLSAALDDGRALKKYEQLIESQGGTFLPQLPLATETCVESPVGGYVHKWDGQELGRAVVELGGGRKQLGDSVDSAVGVEICVRIGDRIERGQLLCKVFARTEFAAEKAVLALLKSVSINSEPTKPLTLIYETFMEGAEFEEA